MSILARWFVVAMNRRDFIKTVVIALGALVTRKLRPILSHSAPAAPQGKIWYVAGTYYGEDNDNRPSYEWRSPLQQLCEDATPLLGGFEVPFVVVDGLGPDPQETIEWTTLA